MFILLFYLNKILKNIPFLDVNKSFSYWSCVGWSSSDLRRLPLTMELDNIRFWQVFSRGLTFILQSSEKVLNRFWQMLWCSIWQGSVLNLKRFWQISGKVFTLLQSFENISSITLAGFKTYPFSPWNGGEKTFGV